MKLSVALPVHFEQKSEFSQKLYLLMRYIQIHWDVYKQRRTLIGLPDERLQDMGISRDDAVREARRLIFDMPEQQLMTRLLTEQDVPKWMK